VMTSIKLDVGPLYIKLGLAVEAKKKGGEPVFTFGLLPLLASCSEGQIGALNAESFAERIISGANLVMTDGNTLLDDKLLEMLVVLRMNRKFMAFMGDHYFPEIKRLQPFNMTIPDEKEKETEA
jgi:hypothetical protein